MKEELERITKVRDYWKFKNWHYVIKASEGLYWYWPYTETLTLTNILLNKKLEMSLIDDEFSLDDIQNIIINYHLFELKYSIDKVL